MKRGTASLVILFLIAAWPHLSRAQNSEAELFHKYVTSDSHVQLIRKAFANEPPTVFQKCPGGITNGYHAKALKPLSFGADGIPSAGVWKEIFPVTGCGNDITLNFFFFATRERIKTIVGFPGSTVAGPELQWDASFYAIAAVNVVVKGCKHFDVKNTRFEANGWLTPPMPDPGPLPKRPWWETWTMIGCGSVYEVPLDFLPDEKGTRIIAPGNVRKVE